MVGLSCSIHHIGDFPMPKTTSEELATFLSDFVNVLGGHSAEEDKFIGLVLSNHRTLQQNTFRLMYKLMQAWAIEGERGNFDMRNEATLKACVKITKTLEEDGYGFFLPYI
jgi:hypothetical protein